MRLVITPHVNHWSHNRNLNQPIVIFRSPCSCRCKLIRNMLESLLVYILLVLRYRLIVDIVNAIQPRIGALRESASFRWYVKVAKCKNAMLIADYQSCSNHVQCPTLINNYLYSLNPKQDGSAHIWEYYTHSTIRSRSCLTSVHLRWFIVPVNWLPFFCA